jgi:hypothetical protein
VTCLSSVRATRWAPTPASWPRARCISKRHP